MCAEYGYLAITPVSNSTPKPGPSGSSMYPSLTVQPPVMISRAHGCAESSNVSWMSMLGIAAPTCTLITVVKGLWALCGAIHAP